MEMDFFKRLGKLLSSDWLTHRITLNVITLPLHKESELFYFLDALCNNFLNLNACPSQSIMATSALIVFVVCMLRTKARYDF